MPHAEGHLTTRDGIRLFEQRWLPDGELRAAIVLVHGFVEHSGRYARTAGDLVRSGYGLFATDLRGHGRSGGLRCYVRSFDRFLDDLDLHVASVRDRAAGKPIVLLGHSLGGLIAVQWCITRQPKLHSLVLSAPAFQLQNTLFPALRRVAGLVGLLLPKLRVAKMGFRYISRDPAIVEGIRADPLAFHDRFPARTGSEILRAMRTASRRYESVLLPLLMLQGTADRVTDPRGCEELCRRAGSADKTLKLYEGLYHEVFNEPEREQVLADLIGWLNQRT